MKTIILNLEGDKFEFVPYSQERMRIALESPKLKLIERRFANKHRSEILTSIPFGKRIKMNSDGLMKIGQKKIIGYNLIPQSFP